MRMNSYYLGLNSLTGLVCRCVQRDSIVEHPPDAFFACNVSQSEAGRISVHGVGLDPKASS